MIAERKTSQVSNRLGGNEDFTRVAINFVELSTVCCFGAAELGLGIRRVSPLK